MEINVLPPPTLQPLHTITAADLAFEAIIGVAVNPAAPTVFVVGGADLVDLAPLFAAYGLWIASALGAVLALMALLLALRVLNRPQKRGAAYCRRCNYDLSAQPQNATQCPECGRAVSGRGTRHGRGLTRRLLTSVGPVVLVIAALAIGTLVARRTLGVQGASYPSLSARDIASRLSFTVPKRFQTLTCVIAEVDLRSGQPLRRFTVENERFPWDDIVVSPSADKLALSGGMSRTLLIVAADDGTPLRSFPLTNFNSGRVSFEMTESTVLVTTHDNGSGSLTEWDLTSGKARAVLQVDSSAKSPYPPGFARVGANKELVASVVDDASADAEESKWRCSIHNLATGARTDIPLPAFPPRRRLMVAASPDGSTLWCASMAGHVAKVDVATGAVRKMPDRPVPLTVDSVAVSPDGRQFVAGGYGSFGLIDVASATWIAVAEFNASPDAMIAFSSDSRYLTCLSVNPSASGFTRTVLIWEAPSSAPSADKAASPPPRPQSTPAGASP